MSDNKEFIWLVAGGTMQIPLAKEIKERGYNLLVTDGNPDAPCRELADQFVVVDTYDIFAHLNLAQSLKERPVAVLTAGADVGPTVSALTDEFDLPGADYEVAKRVRNKAEMRRALNLDYPAWTEIRFDEMDHSFSWRMHCRRKGIDQYPCVVKPLEGAGSRGITFVDSPWKWHDAVKKARLADKKRNKTFLVEQYIKSETEIATDNFIVDGDVVFANAVKRYFSKDIFGIELGHMNPYTLNAEIKRKIQFAAKTLGVVWGPFKCDFICHPDRGWIIAECATRLSGGFDHMYAAKIATGKDITGYMLDMALGNEVKAKGDRRLWNTNKKFAFTYAPILEPGKFTEIHFPTNFPSLKYIFNTAKNGTIEKLENCSQRPLFLIVEGDTEFQTIRCAKTIEKAIEVEYE